MLQKVNKKDIIMYKIHNKNKRESSTAYVVAYYYLRGMSKKCGLREGEDI